MPIYFSGRIQTTEKLNRGKTIRRTTPGVYINFKGQHIRGPVGKPPQRDWFVLGACQIPFFFAKERAFSHSEIGEEVLVS